MLMLIEKYVCGKNSLHDFIKFLSDEYYVDVIDGKVELLPFNNMNYRILRMMVILEFK